LKIADHHLKDEWRPLLAWPEDCYVQWGGSGLVLGREPGESYGTAFFEAFPKGDSGGFVRGEGPTIEEAEADAHGKWTRASACDHRFSRKGYTNGGAICRKCGHFATVFKPIVKLGSWAKPIEAQEIAHALGGYLCPWPNETESSNKFHRRLLLRIRAAGMAIPDPIPRTSIRSLEVQDWVRRSETVVRAWLRLPGNDRILEPTERKDGVLVEFFGSMDQRRLQRLLTEPSSESIRRTCGGGHLLVEVYEPEAAAREALRMGVEIPEVEDRRFMFLRTPSTLPVAMLTFRDEAEGPDALESVLGPDGGHVSPPYLEMLREYVRMRSMEYCGLNIEIDWEDVGLAQA
jgi:hypothetical protein